MASGKAIRLNRLRHTLSSRSLIVPLDHGATVGPIEGIAALDVTLGWLSETPGLVQGVVLHRGAMRHGLARLAGPVLPPLILHVSASSQVDPEGTTKSIVATVEDALQLGADAVSVHVNLGVPGEGAMMRDFGALAAQCQRWALPLLAMMYVRPEGKTSTRTEDVALAARIAAETGADMVKVSYPGSSVAMQEVVAGCFIPVLIAGGDKNDDAASLRMVEDAVAGGAAGVCIGRNLFQAAARRRMLIDMAEALHGNAGVANPPPNRTPVHDLIATGVTRIEVVA